MTTMFSNGCDTRLRRRRGSGNRAKNCLMESGVSDEARNMGFLGESGDLHGDHSRPLAFFNPSKEN
jgi:hypothetical protein